MDTQKIIKDIGDFFNNFDDSRLIAAYLFGSFVEGRMRGDSDLDIAILDKQDQPLNMQEQARIMDQLERSLNTAVDLRMMRKQNLSFQEYVVHEGLLCYEQLPHLHQEYINKLNESAAKQQNDSSWNEIINRLAEKTESRA